MEPTKTCTRCGLTKPVSEFGSKRGRKDGLKSHCRACEAAYQREHYQANQEREREKARLSMQKRREDPDVREQLNASRRGNPRIAARQREYIQDLMQRHFFIWRARNWSSRHGVVVTASELFWLWYAQRGKCALSGRKLDRRAHLDHVDAKSNGGAHTIDNLRWIDPYINVAKNNLTDAEFIAMCREVDAWNS
jgi:hypothetical protein